MANCSRRERERESSYTKLITRQKGCKMPTLLTHQSRETPWFFLDTDTIGFARLLPQNTLYRVEKTLSDVYIALVHNTGKV